MIIIRFIGNVEHDYESFNEILNLDNYNKIIGLDCSNNNLTNLPELPESLTHLYCYNNNLTSLPKLPKSLIKLWCFNNNSTSLPELPKSLTHLFCVNNNLKRLPELPESLRFLHCYNNNLPIQLNKLPQETMKEYIKRCNEYYYDCNAIKIQKFFKNIILAPKRAVQILLAKSVENFYYSPDCKVMMKIREKQWKKHFK